MNNSEKQQKKHATPPKEEKNMHVEEATYVDGGDIMMELMEEVKSQAQTVKAAVLL